MGEPGHLEPRSFQRAPLPGNDRGGPVEEKEWSVTSLARFINISFLSFSYKIMLVKGMLGRLDLEQEFASRGYWCEGAFLLPVLPWGWGAPAVVCVVCISLSRGLEPFQSSAPLPPQGAAS